MPNLSNLIKEPRFFYWHLGIALCVLALGIWFSSGTMPLYAITGTPVLVIDNHVVNRDHYYFEATYKFLDGQPKENWEMHHIYLRRILFPILSYPLMKLFGYLQGGFVMSVIVNLIAVSIFVFFMRKRYGPIAALTSLWILATYPGITYWAGLPYNHTMIVPCTLLSSIMLFKIYEAQNWYNIFLWSLFIGILQTGYELHTYFAPAAVLLLGYRRKFMSIIPAIIGIALPMYVELLYFTSILHIDFAKEPSNAVYVSILNSYLHISSFYDWFILLRKVPLVFINDFFTSNFIFLPLTFLGVLYLRYFKNAELAFSPVEIAIALSVLFVFLFNELAPPYEARWVMRGYWIARIYQPIFISFLLYISRFCQLYHNNLHIRKYLYVLAIVIFMGNSVVIAGPMTKNKVSSYVYFLFYKQRGDYDMMITNLNKYGRRPIGFCK